MRAEGSLVDFPGEDADDAARGDKGMTIKVSLKAEGLESDRWRC